MIQVLTQDAFRDSMGFSLKKRISHREKMAGDARYTLRTLRKGLLVLEALEAAGEDLTLTEIGLRVGESSTSGPVKRFQDDNEALKRHVKKAGEEISAKLGHRA